MCFYSLFVIFVLSLDIQLSKGKGGEGEGGGVGIAFTQPYYCPYLRPRHRYPTPYIVSFCLLLTMALDEM